MKLGKVIEVAESLSYLGQLEDLFCAYPVAKNIVKVKEHVARFSHDKRGIIDKHVLKNDGIYQLTEDKTSFEFGKNTMEFEEEVKALQDEEVTIEFETIEFEDLKNSKGEKINLPANVIASLIDVIIKD